MTPIPHPSSTPLLEFSNVRLSYNDEMSSSSPSSTTTFATQPFCWPIHPPDLTNDNLLERQGGYALLGRNGTAKSLLGLSLMATTQNINLREKEEDDPKNNPFVLDGSLSIPSTSRWHSRAVAHVSFHSHQELLQERDEKTGESLTAFKAITTAGGAPGKLSPAAQFLVVRFGLYPLMHRTVNTLSTGEIRKVLLIRALSQRPKLLVLDNAFDGLDVPSRGILKDLVSRTLRGFTQDILVQGISSKATARTQVVLTTHRAEEIVDEIDTVAWFKTHSADEDGGVSSQFQMFKRQHPDGEEPMPSADALHRALGMDVSATASCSVENDRFKSVDWQDSTLPSVEAVEKWWRCGQSPVKSSDDGKAVVVEANDLTIRRGDTTLLHSLDWTVRQGERWIVGGGNGAGKSTLSRLLANPDFMKDVHNESSLLILPNADPTDPRSGAVGWVSTETHLRQHQGPRKGCLPTTKTVLESETDNASWNDVISPVLTWLEVADSKESQSTLLERPFHHWSQGQQKLLLLAAAIAKRPPLLVLDEPCQGLDLIARQRLLQVVERLCSSTDMSLIYITHHLEEEKMPNISHALHLKDRRVVYQGPIDDYDPADFYTPSNDS